MENVGALTFRGLDAVLGSLAEIGYDAEWQDIRASDVGAPHRRERIWIVAYPNIDSESSLPVNALEGRGELVQDVAYPDSEHGQRRPEPQLAAGAGGQSRDQPARGGAAGNVADTHETRSQGQRESGSSGEAQSWAWSTYECSGQNWAVESRLG